MPLCLIVGLPQIIRRRAPKFRLRREKWSFDYIDSHDDYIDLAQIWDQVLRKADNNTSGTHIFAFVSANDDRKHFEPTVLLRHRLIWLTKAEQDAIYARRFVQRMDELLAFEEEWIEGISPKSVRSALVLPDISFEARPPHDALWKRSARLQLDGADTIDRVNKELNAFRDSYYMVASELRGCWVDSKRRIFDIPDTRLWHAKNVPVAHKWKCTWEVPHGFHYDVRHESKRAFEVLDHDREKRRYNSYVNIDTHNHHRGRPA